MAHCIRVTGYLYIEDDEFDPHFENANGTKGWITEETYETWSGSNGQPAPEISELDDLRIEYLPVEEPAEAQVKPQRKKK